MSDIQWLSAPEQHDYPAARSYLSLLLSPKEVDELISRILEAETTLYKAKDILRAAKVKALGVENRHVERDLKKIKNDEPLSPILLVRGNLSIGTLLTIADGYHRVCAAYLHDEDVEVACQIVDIG